MIFGHVCQVLMVSGFFIDQICRSLAGFHDANLLDIVHAEMGKIPSLSKAGGIPKLSR